MSARTERLLSTLKDIETGERGYVLIGSEDYLEPYTASLSALDGDLAAVDKGATELSAQAPDLTDLQRAVRQKTAFAASVVSARRQNGFETARSMLESGVGKRLMDDARREVASINRTAAGRVESARASEGRLILGAGLAFATVLLSAGFFAYSGYRSRQASRRADGLLAQVIENAPVGLAFLDERNQVLRPNRAFADALGQTPAALAGKALHVSSPAFFAAVSQEIARMRRQSARDLSAPIDVEVAGPDGDTHLAASFYRVGDASGLGVVAVDMTRQRLWERQIEAAREEADAANRAKSAFIANMSHELRTPLSAVIGYCELLEDEIVELGHQSLLRDLGKINTNARHLLGLINDVLDLSKIEAQKMDIHATEFEVAAMLGDIESAIGSLVAKKHNVLRIEGETSGVVVSDELKVRQILLNLIGNAAKFTENGEIVLSVSRRDIEGRENIVFSVRDSGIGMTADQVANLFERFMQADETTTRRFGGTGLGLALTKALSIMLGGSISVASEPGVGSTFTVAFPARFEAALADDESLSPEAEAQAHGERGRVVLVIDDDPAAREFLSRFLVREGYEVETASNGEEGLRKVRGRHPIAVLLDVTMPGMDGWNVLREIRADPEIASTPVVMQTVIDEQTFGYALGATDYLLKPVDRARLREAMAGILPSASARSVLVVDDDGEARNRVAAALSREGWAVTSVDGGEAALEAMRRERPDIILVDLLMPGMDGYAVIRAVREEQAWRDIPIVVLTSEDLGSARLRALATTTSRIVQKGSMPLSDLAADLRRVVRPITHPVLPGSPHSP